MTKDPQYDSYFGFVFRCASADRCRQLAELNAGDEGPLAWSTATITPLAYDVQGKEELILADFNAG